MGDLRAQIVPQICDPEFSIIASSLGRFRYTGRIFARLLSQTHELLLESTTTMGDFQESWGIFIRKYEISITAPSLGYV